jgi:outer membrane protein
MKNVVFGLAAFALPLIAGAQSTSADPPLKLSLREAVATALGPRGDPRLALAQAGVQQAQARLNRAKSLLLPSVDLFAAEQGQARSLDAFGLSLVQFPLPGFAFPAAVGPFATFDARISVSQNFFDRSARKRADASQSALDAATAETRVARNQVAAQVALRYLAALRAARQEEVNQADIKLAEALLHLAERRQSAGEATGLDITRATAQLSTERQRLLTAESERAIAHLELLRILGVSMEIQLVLTDTLESVAAPAQTVQEAVEQAFQNRGELAAQLKRIEGSRLSDRAAELEKRPLITGYGDYGVLGSTRMAATYTVGLAVRVPVFDGGRRQSNRSDALAEVRRQELQAGDMRRQIELDVRRAYENLRLAARQIETSEQILRLADDELAHAQRRYEAGLLPGIEILETQTRLARSRDDRVAAQYRQAVAMVELASGMGTVDSLFQ